MAVINKNTFTGPSLPLSNRIRRLVWNLVQGTLFRFSPRPFHEWRSILLRAFGARVGRGVHVYPRAMIWAPWNLEIGEESGFADGVRVYSQAKIKLGRRVVVSQGVHLCAGTHNYEEDGFPLITESILIGDYAWIAAEAFVHPGVTVHNGAVVGARSVVTKDVPAWTVCAGHPCKPLKPRLWRPNAQ